MKKSLLIAAAAAISCAISANAADLGKVYVVPVGEGGTAVKLEDGTYEGQVAMGENPGESGITVNDVEIEHGFIFYAMSTDGTMNTLYGLPYWATKPAIVGLENPLEIAGRIDGFYATVSPGKYDITFYRMSGYNYFSVKQSDDPEAVVYPSQIFIMTASNAIPLSGADGQYSGKIVLPESFRVSYENSYDLPTFIYGPATAGATLVNDVAMDLALRENTSATITYAADSGLRAGNKVNVDVDIRPGSERLLVTKVKTTGIDDVEADSNAPARYYDLGGRMLSSAPDAPGVYIMLRDGKATKIAVR